MGRPGRGAGAHRGFANLRLLSRDPFPTIVKQNLYISVTAGRPWKQQGGRLPTPAALALGGTGCPEPRYEN